MTDVERERLLEAVKTPMGDNGPINRKKLGAMVNGYVRAALETATDTTFGGPNTPLSDTYTKFDIDEPTLAQMIRDCVAFYWRHRAVLETIYENAWDEKEAQKEVGAAFCHTRNQKTKGSFSKLGNGPEYEILQAGARGFGVRKLWVNERGEVAWAPAGI